jgi:hypothetical protein
VPKRIANSKELRVIIKALRPYGIVATRRGGGHIGLEKDGQLISVLPSSPSDWRSLKNKVAELRRMGYKI